MREESRYAPRTALISVEQTSNGGGGTVWPLAAIESVADVACQHGIPLHMDGARLMNAVVASGVAARDYAKSFDSVWIDLSKGLGCPVGGVLAGSAEFVKRAWQWKQRMGGAMRQAGIVAAAGVYALENNVERLAEDHANARLLADRLAAVPGIVVEPEAVETNIVFFDVKGTGDDGGRRLSGSFGARRAHRPKCPLSHARRDPPRRRPGRRRGGGRRPRRGGRRTLGRLKAGLVRS